MEQSEDQKYIWREIHKVNKLHQELASLYRTKSNDKRTINALWFAIEQREAILTLQGIEVA